MVHADVVLKSKTDNVETYKYYSCIKEKSPRFKRMGSILNNVGYFYHVRPRFISNQHRIDMKNFFIVIISVLSGTVSLSFPDSYDRKDFNYHSYKPNTSIGFYTNKTCDFINIDHIVSLKDAYESGAASWGASRKKAFANDTSNHVPSCGRVNSSKGSEGPSDFLRRSRDGKGLEYEIVRFCEYMQKYYAVKVKYGLSLQGNSKSTFATCDISL